VSAGLEDVIKELKALGLTAQVVRGAEAINVWMDNTEMPDATVWPPRGDNGWAWGHSFQWGADADADADAVACRVAETLAGAGLMSATSDTNLFKLEIETGNTAFTENPGELGRVLRVLADQVDKGVVAGPVIDGKGLQVGTFWFGDGYATDADSDD
jgi:hypothetical protein